jgi:hypothetical protein
MGAIDLNKFYKACNPSKPLVVSIEEDRKYYIDLSAVRGGKMIDALKRTITRISPDEPTCQLFTGHIGAGKSTELLRLQAELEQEGFVVVYFESSQYLDVADVDITDILLAIAWQVSEALAGIKIKLQPGLFTRLFQDIGQFLQTPIELNAEAEISLGIAKIHARTKESPQVRRRLREYLEPRTSNILAAINTELIKPVQAELKRRGKSGLVVIVDNLDRITYRLLPSGRSQPEYLFIDRGDELRQLACHIVYTIPLALAFCNDAETLKNRLGGGLIPQVLPMVQVRSRDGQFYQPGMDLLRHLVLSRAFPEATLTERLNLVPEVFDSLDTLDRLCQISGGHLRNLLGLLYDCLRQEDPPISRECLESAIRQRRDFLVSPIDNREWDLLFQVVQEQTVKGDEEYQTLLKSMLVFEYRDQQGCWYSLNPALEETKQFQLWASHIP